MPKYAELIYNGFWFSPEREMLQAAIDHSQVHVSGTVRLKLYKGLASVVGRKSPNSLYSEKVVTFEDDAGAYDQKDAAGFIKLNALRMRIAGNRASKLAAGAKAKTRAKPAGSVKAAKSSAATKPSVAKKATKAAKPR